MQGLKLMPATFSLTAGTSANATVAGIVNVTNGNVANIYNYVAEVHVDRGYEVCPALSCMATLSVDVADHLTLHDYIQCSPPTCHCLCALLLWPTKSCKVHGACRQSRLVNPYNCMVEEKRALLLCRGM